MLVAKLHYSFVLSIIFMVEPLWFSVMHCVGVKIRVFE
jgi:hypothetical protein